MHPAALEVWVLDRVDVDREAERVHRPALRPGADHVTAVEGGRVVGGKRALVHPAVGVDGPQPANRKAGVVEAAEDAYDVADGRGVDDHRPRVSTRVEAPV
jgi:hypothetical protein